MNILMVLTCATCGQDTDCRVGFSNRRIQPLQFPCHHCSSLIGIILDTTLAPAYEVEFKGADQIEEQQYAPFDGRNPFMDLHLDFPVAQGPYKMGFTPFMVAMQRIRDTTPNESLLRLQDFNAKLGQLNFFANQNDQVRALIRLYFGKNKQLFKMRVGEFIKQPQGNSLLKQDINATLYRLVSLMFLPFIRGESVREFVKDLTLMQFKLASTKRAAFDKFVAHCVDTGFLDHIQRDCLELYPEVYDAELALRPAIFLDHIDDPEDALVAGRVSAADFNGYKDLYKDICEVLGRLLSLVAGMNNVIHRDDFNTFAATKDGPGLSSLDKFAEKVLGDKFKYLDDCWFNLDKGAIHTGIRNGVAHHFVEYDEITQLISYFPEREGIRQQTSETMSLLAFMRLVLQAFREMHYLHHLVKVLIYYDLLIRRTGHEQIAEIT